MAQVTMEGAEYAALVKQADKYDELVNEIITSFELTKDGYPGVLLKVATIMAEKRVQLILDAIAENPDFIKRAYAKGYRYMDKTTHNFYSDNWSDTVDLCSDERIAYIWQKLEEGTFDGEDEEV